MVMRQIAFYLFWALTSLVYGQDKVNFLSENNSGFISLRVVAYGKKSKDAVMNAELFAIQTILFRGVPGSNQVEYPLIGTDEKTIIEKHSDYFRQFFKQERFRTFIISNVPVSKFGKDVTGKKCITTDVKVNLRSLRLDLEGSGIIRKFGF